MPHNTEMIELTLRLETTDELKAAGLAENLSRLMVGFSAEPGVEAALMVDRYQVHCSHEHDDEFEVEP